MYVNDARSPLVSTPNVNNFLDIRSQILDTSDFSSFSDSSMFIFEVFYEGLFGWGHFGRGKMGMGKQEEDYEITSSWWCVINRKRSGDTRVDFALRIRQLRLGLKMMTDRINIKNLGNPHLSADRVSFFIINLRKNKLTLS